MWFKMPDTARSLPRAIRLLTAVAVTALVTLGARAQQSPTPQQPGDI